MMFPIFFLDYQQLEAEVEGFKNKPLADLEDYIFFVPKEACWNIISESAHTPEIGKAIDDALLAIE